MRNIAPLQRRVLARRKCRPMEAIGVTVEIAMTATVALLFIIVMTVEGVTPHHSNMPMDMAKARHAVPMPGAIRNDAIRILVTRDGAVYFGHTAIHVREITDRVRESLRGNSERRAYLMVDGRAKYGDVEAVVDAIRGGGLWRIGLMVEQDRR
jgi:biopolymer transport protein ExbD